jgi:hypothetical protein
MRATTRAITGLIMAGIASVCLTIPASSQSAASRIDQPTAGTLPPGTSTVYGNEMKPGGSGPLPPPSALGTSVDVMKGVDNGPGDEPGRRTNPTSRLPSSGR